MMKDKKKIIWEDAVIVNLKNNARIPTKMETVGYIQKDEDDYIVVAEPVTRRISNGSNYPEGKNPNFIFIPRGMIKSMKRVEK